MTTPDTARGPRPEWRGRWAVLAGSLLWGLDAWEMAASWVALPSMGSDLGLTTAQYQWLIAAYVLPYGGLLLLGGRLVDRYGTRRTVLPALVLFVLASAVIAVAATGTQGIAARAVKGAAIALIVPASLALVRRAVPHPDRMQAMATYYVLGAAGYAGGLVLGGLATSVSWRITNGLTAVMAGVLLIPLWRRLPDAEATQHRPLRAWPATCTAAGMVTVVFALTELPRGWSAQLLVAIALSASFLMLGRLDDGRMLAPRWSWRATGLYLAAASLPGAFAAFSFGAMLYLQHGLTLSPLTAAFMLLPVNLVVMLLSRLLTRKPRPLAVSLALAFGSFTAGYLLAAWMVGRDSLSPAAGALVVLLAGVGFSFAQSPLTHAATAGADDEAHAAARLHTAYQLGTAAVLALAAGVIGAAGADAADPALRLAAYRAGMLLPAALAGLVAVVAAIAALVGTRRPAADDAHRH